MESKILWWPFLLQHKGSVILIIVAGIITSYCTLLLPLSIGKYMAIVFEAGGSKTKALQLLGIHLPDQLPVFFFFFFTVLFVKFLSAWAYNYFASMLGESFVVQLRQTLFNYRLGLQEPNNSNTAISLLIPFGNDVKTMSNLLVNGVLGLVKDGLFLLMSLYILFSLQAVLTTSVVIMIILFYGVHRWFNLAHKPLFKEKRKKQSDLLDYASQVFHGKERSTLDPSAALAVETDKLFLVLGRFHAKKSLLRALTPFMLYLMLAVIMGIVISGFQMGELKAGEIVIYILLLMTLFPTIRNVIRIEHTWVQGNLAARKFMRASLKTPNLDGKEIDLLKKVASN
jgi:ABC-type multidrug transport system fused ATPase/permease subunit